MLTLSQFEESYRKLVGYFTAGIYQDEMLTAKKDFFSNTGILDENRANYALRMTQFFDWYFLTRKLSSHMKTPLAVAASQRDLRLSAEDIETIDVLNRHEHSLYEVLKNKNGVLTIRDLFAGKKMDVHSEGLIFSFEDKETFEARVIGVGGKNYFLKGFCFHPQSALKYITEELKLYRKNPDLNFKDFLIRLNKMRYKLEQYSHIKPEMIYTNENKLRL